MIQTPAWLSLLFEALPGTLLWVVGVVLALATWRRHPAVSQLVLLACLVLVIQSAGGILVQMWVRDQFRNLASSAQTYRLAMRFLEWACILLRVVGYGLLLGAVFGWRDRPVTPWRPRERLDERIDTDLGGASGRKSSDIRKEPHAEER